MAQLTAHGLVALMRGPGDARGEGAGALDVKHGLVVMSLHCHLMGTSFCLQLVTKAFQKH